jgi:3-oxoacyl-[acyl-carrier protein] reductase
MAIPQEIANAAAFLASPRSTFTSGINMIVDGAMTDRVNY